MKASLASIECNIEPAVIAAACCLYGCQLSGNQGRPTLRVLIEHENAGQGVTIADCERVARQIRSLLTVESSDLLTQYYLEVSSPGLERPLWKPVHFERMIGQQIAIRLQQPRDGQRRFAGELMKANAEEISLSMAEGVMTFSLAAIAAANRVANF